MGKIETQSMEHVAMNGPVAKLLRTAVATIPEERETRLGEMDANLMHAAGDRYNFYEGTDGRSGEKAIMGHRLFPPPGDGTDTIVAMTAR